MLAVENRPYQGFQKDCAGPLFSAAVSIGCIIPASINYVNTLFRIW